MPRSQARAQRAPHPRPVGSMAGTRVTETMFDSHRFVKRLTGAGLAENVAEVLADEFSSVLIGQGATRTDPEDTTTELKASINDFRRGLEASLDEFERRISEQLDALRSALLKWMFVALTVQTVIIVSLVKLT